MQKLNFVQFAEKYTETQMCEAKELLARLQKQKEVYRPDGWFLAECQVLDSSYRGTRVILPYGVNNTYKEPPNGCFSPRGLASDQSVVIAVLANADLP